MSEFSNVKLKRKSYFINEAIRLMQENGVENLSARTVALNAGFNASSIYTYFENMDHLESLACIFFTKDYLLEIDKAFQSTFLWIEKYLLMWELFLKHSFNSPKAFSKVFYPVSQEPWTYELYKEYFAMFPDKINFQDAETMKFISIGSTQKGFHRDLYLLTNAHLEGSLLGDRIEYVTEINIAYTYYIVCDIINGAIDPNDQKHYYKCLSYIATTLLSSATDEYKSLILNKIEQYNNLKNKLS